MKADTEQTYGHTMHKQLKQNAAKMVRNGLWELDDTDSSGF